MTLQMAFLSFTDMMKNKIKANAPKGATHYSRQINRYFKYHEDRIYVFKYNGWLLEHGIPPRDTTPIGQNDYGH